MGQQSILTSTLEVRGLVLLHQKVVENTIFWKRQANFKVKKRFCPNFWQNLECNKPHLPHYTGQQSILTITVEDTGLILEHKKLLKTQLFEEKTNFPVKKSFWPVFSLILECDKPEGLKYEYPRSILTITFEVKGLILLHLRSCWKHKFLKKKANFPVKKSFCCIFSRFIECDRPEGTIYEGPQGDLTITVEVKRSYL